MNRKLKNSILFVCLNEPFGKSVSKSLAQSLSMHFADCKDLIEYDLFNSGEVLTQCGEEYYLMREQKVIKMTCNYENTLMFCGYDIFNHNQKTFEKYSTIVYLKLSKKLLSSEDKINIIAYEERNNELEKKADVIVNLKRLNEKSALKEICNVLGELKWI